jgi:hypothetical protein
MSAESSLCFFPGCGRAGFGLALGCFLFMPGSS